MKTTILIYKNNQGCLVLIQEFPHFHETNATTLVFDCDSMDLLQSSLRYQGPTPMHTEANGQARIEKTILSTIRQTYSWNININIAPSSTVVK